MKGSVFSLRLMPVTICLIMVLPSLAFAVETAEIGNRTIVDLHTIALANGNVQLSWSPVPAATGYKVYRAANPVPFDAVNWKPLARVTNTSYVTTGDADKRFYCVTWDDIPASTVNFAIVEGGTFNNGTSDDRTPENCTSIKWTYLLERTLSTS